MSAYGSKWDVEGWQKFARRHLNELEYLIPDNKSGQSLKNQLYESLQHIHS